MTPGLESVTALWVRPNDLDSLGHANNASVLEYLECGRWGWLEEHGRERSPLVIAVVARIEIDYRRMIDSRRVHVRTVLESAPEPDELGYRVVFSQGVLLGDPQTDTGQAVEAARARVEVGFFHTGDQRLATVDEFFTRAPEESPKP